MVAEKQEQNSSRSIEGTTTAAQVVAEDRVHRYSRSHGTRVVGIGRGNRAAMHRTRVMHSTYANTFATARSSSSLFLSSFRIPRSACACFRLPYLSPFSLRMAERIAAGVTNSAAASHMSNLCEEREERRTRVGIHRSAAECAFKYTNGREDEAGANLCQGRLGRSIWL